MTVYVLVWGYLTSFEIGQIAAKATPDDGGVPAEWPKGDKEDITLAAAKVFVRNLA